MIIIIIIKIIIVVTIFNEIFFSVHRKTGRQTASPAF